MAIVDRRVGVSSEGDAFFTSLAAKQPAKQELATHLANVGVATLGHETRAVCLDGGQLGFDTPSFDSGHRRREKKGAGGSKTTQSICV
jgi:hypothetical protein